MKHIFTFLVLMLPIVGALVGCNNVSGEQRKADLIDSSHTPGPVKIVTVHKATVLHVPKAAHFNVMGDFYLSNMKPTGTAFDASSTIVYEAESNTITILGKGTIWTFNVIGKNDTLNNSSPSHVINLHGEMIGTGYDSYVKSEIFYCYNPSGKLDCVMVAIKGEMTGTIFVNK